MDLALVWDADRGSADLAVDGDDLASDAGLRTAVVLSLFTDRRAEDDDRLPSGDADRRGWWADEFAEVEGDRFGSRLWLLDRSARRPDVPRLAEEYAKEALAWMVEDRVADRVEATAQALGTALALEVTIYRPSGDRAAFRFDDVWQATVAA